MLPIFYHSIIQNFPLRGKKSRLIVEPQLIHQGPSDNKLQQPAPEGRNICRKNRTTHNPLRSYEVRWCYGGLPGYRRSFICGNNWFMWFILLPPLPTCQRAQLPDKSGTVSISPPHLVAPSPPLLHSLILSFYHSKFLHLAVSPDPPFLPGMPQRFFRVIHHQKRDF